MEKLPAKASAGTELATIGPGDLDGWGVEECVAALATVIAPRMEPLRLATGLLLWKLRTLLPDGDYGGQVVQLSEQIGVAERTLRDWRVKAEHAYGLDAPSLTTKARRSGIEFAKGKRATPPAAPPEGGRATPSRAPERLEPDEVPASRSPRRDKAAKTFSADVTRHEQPSLPGAENWGWVLSRTVLELVELPRADRRALMRRLAEADRLDRRASASRPAGRSSVPVVGCPHPKPMRKQVGFGTICDPQAGGCGAKVT